MKSLTNDDIMIGIYDTEKLIINIPGRTFLLFEMAESFSAIVEQTIASIEDIRQSNTRLTDRVSYGNGNRPNVGG